MLQFEKIAVTTVGSAGAAVGTNYSTRPIDGEIMRVTVDWSGSAPGTSDIAITVEADDNHLATTLYSKSNAVADVDLYPRIQACGTDGSAVAGIYVPIVAQGRVKVVIGDCDALAVAATVYVFVRKR